MAHGRVFQMAFILTLSAISIFSFSGCGGSSAPSAGDGGAPKTADKVDTSRCIEVSAEKLAEIEAKLNIRGGGSLKDGRAVKSNDFENRYFLAAEVEGPGFYDDGQYAIWLVDSLEPGGEIISVSSNAKVFSDWPKADATITKDNDGYAEAQTCVEAFQKGL